MPKAESRQLQESDVPPPVDPDQNSFDAALHERIKLAAYYRSLRRGFVPGEEEADWYAAEEEEKTRNTDDRSA